MHCIYKLTSLVLLLLQMALCPAPAQAARQELSAVYATVQRYLQEQLPISQGKARADVSKLDSSLYLPQCKQLEAYLPAGARLAGQTFIGVRCITPSQWSLNVPVSVAVKTDVIVTARPIHAGAIIAQEDIVTRTQDQGNLTQPTFTSPDQVIGKIAITGIAAGLTLRQEMLRAPFVVTQNQTVKVIVLGDGFQINTEGKALGNAAAGQTVKIRTANGQIIHGAALANGNVEVSQ